MAGRVVQAGEVRALAKSQEEDRSAKPLGGSQWSGASGHLWELGGVDGRAVGWSWAVVDVPDVPSGSGRWLNGCVPFMKMCDFLCALFCMFVIIKVWKHSQNLNVAQEDRGSPQNGKTEFLTNLEAVGFSVCI